MSDIDQIKVKAIPVLKQAGVIRSSLFGSCVRGENSPQSDIDFLIEFPRGKSLLDLVALKDELEKTLGKSVDLVTYKSINPLLRDQILTEQMPLYD